MQWADVLNDPSLRDLPYKIELNEQGRIEMSPASNRHGIVQGNLFSRLRSLRSDGQIYLECSIQTSKGVRVADIAWGSDSFYATHGVRTPLPLAPELCVEVLSPGNTASEMQGKIDLYLPKGAREVWLVNDQEEIAVYSHAGKVEKSTLFDLGR